MSRPSHAQPPPRQEAPAANQREQIERLGPWFHNLHLPGGLQTAPEHWLGDFPAFKWKRIGHTVPEDLTGWSCLDIGCNAGFYSIELARRGARVLAIDHDRHYLAQARWAAGQLGLAERIRFEQREVYGLAEIQERFDLVWFMGVLYHLRYPLLALDLIADKVRRKLVLQTLMMAGEEQMEVPEDLAFEDRERMHARGFPKMAFLEHKFAGDPTNWWMVNHAGLVAMLSSAGLRVVEQPDEETYVCVPMAAQRAFNRALPRVRTEDPR